MTSSILAGEKRWNSARRGGMTVLGKVAAPKPLNLPSQRLENHGLDPNVEIVPKGTLTWGSKSSTVANAWSGSLNNNSSGISSSHYVNGRPSSAGSSSRPSTAGSDKVLEPGVSARGPNSRPSSASGSLASSQTSATSMRPHSSETRAGTSQLSRFAESPSGSRSVAWSAAGAPRRSEESSSKCEEFSLAGGDFPRLGTEKHDSGKSAQTRGDGCVGGPAAEANGVKSEAVPAKQGDDGWRHHAGSVPQQHEMECWHGAGNAVPAGGYWFRGPPPPQGFPYGVVPFPAGNFHPEQYRFYGARVPFVAANPNVRPSMHGGDAPDAYMPNPPIMGPSFGYPGGVLTNDGFYMPYPPNNNGCLWRPHPSSHRQWGASEDEMDRVGVKIPRGETRVENSAETNSSNTLMQQIESLNAKARSSGSPSKMTNEHGSGCRLLLSKSSSSSDENRPRAVSIFHNKKAKPSEVVQEEDDSEVDGKGTVDCHQQKLDEDAGARVADIGDGQAQRALMRQLAKKRAKQRQEEEEQREKEQKAKALAKLEELNRRIESDESSSCKVLSVDEEALVLPQQSCSNRPDAYPDLNGDASVPTMPAASASASAVEIDPKHESEKQRSKPARRNRHQHTRAVVWAPKKKEEASIVLEKPVSSSSSSHDGGKRAEMERYAPKSRESAAPPPPPLSTNLKIEFGSLKSVEHDALSPEPVKAPPPRPEPVKAAAATPLPSKGGRQSTDKVTAKRNHKDSNHRYNNRNHNNPVAPVKQQPHVSVEVHGQDVRTQWKPKAQQLPNHHQCVDEQRSVSRSKNSSGAADGRVKVPVPSDHNATAADPQRHKHHHRSSASYHRKNGARRAAGQADENDVHVEYQPIHRGGAAAAAAGRGPPRHRY